jgi:hypothetical protein
MNKEKVSKELVEDVISEETVRKTLKRAMRCYSNLQAEDGFWPGDYGGPLFLLPSLVLLPFPSFFLFNNFFIGKNRIRNLSTINISISSCRYSNIDSLNCRVYLTQLVLFAIS